MRVCTLQYDMLLSQSNEKKVSPVSIKASLRRPCAVYTFSIDELQVFETH